MKETCATCYYRTKKSETQGECRRYPPQMTFVMMPVQTGNVLEKRMAVVPQGLAGFPIVNDDQGCGEHSDLAVVPTTGSH